MSGSYWITQTSKFLLINATAVTLSQGHGKVIQYISPDQYVLCTQYERFSSNSFDMRGKSFCAADADVDTANAADAVETNWKHKVTPYHDDLTRVT